MSEGRGGSVYWSSVFIKAVFKSTVNHVKKIFRVAVDMIVNGSYFPSGRKGIICTAVGDTCPAIREGEACVPLRPSTRR